MVKKYIHEEPKLCVYKKGACAEGTKCLLLIVASDVDEEVSFVFIRLFVPFASV